MRNIQQYPDFHMRVSAAVVADLYNINLALLSLSPICLPFISFGSCASCIFSVWHHFSPLVNLWLLSPLTTFPQVFQDEISSCCLLMLLDFLNTSKCELATCPGHGLSPTGFLSKMWFALFSVVDQALVLVSDAVWLCQFPVPDLAVFNQVALALFPSQNIQISVFIIAFSFHQKSFH